MTPRARGAAVALVALTALLSGLPALWNGFAWDDRPLIVENRLMRQPGGATALLTSGFWQAGDRHDRFRAFYRPLVSLSYAAESRLWGVRPFGFHLTNLLAHLGCALLVTALLARREPWFAALMGGLVFAAHPVHVESVAWISGRTDLFCALFTLLAFVLDRPGGRRDPAAAWRRAGALGAFFLALLSKEMAATLPILLCADRVLRPGPWPARLRLAARTALPYLVILAGYVALRRVILGPEPEALFQLGPLSWLATAIFVVARDATLLLLPLGLNPHYPYAPRATLVDPVVILAAILLAVTMGAAAWWARRSRRAAFAFAWMAIALLPVLRFGTFGDVLLADRFLYLPSVGLACLLARAVASRSPLGLGATRRLARAILLLVAALLGLSAWQTRLWRDDRTLFTALRDTSPTSAMVRSNLGLALYDAGDYEAAKEEFRTALVLAPGYALAHNNLAAAFEREGRLLEASRHYREALRLAPRQVEAQINLASLMVRLGHAAEGLARLRALTREHPRYPAVRYALADALERTGRDQEAIAEAREALLLDPTYAEPWYLIGKVRYDAGRPREAVEALQRFLDLWRHDDEHRRAAQALVSGITPPADPR